MKKRRSRLFIITLVTMGIIGYLVYTGIRDTMLYYLTVSEVIASDPQTRNGGVRVSGKVIEGSILWNPKDLKLKFVLADEKSSIPVVYQGVVPDSFRQGRKVVIEGAYKDGVLTATQIMPTCPSKYE